MTQGPGAAGLLPAAHPAGRRRGSPRRSSTASARVPGSRRAPRVAGSSPAAIVPTATDVVAGGNLGVTFSTGDITQGAFGTITSVCNGLVRGFGHPFNLLGKTTYGMSGAETLYIQEDPAGPPFTVANFGPTLGTINQDRNLGVSGPLGAAAQRCHRQVRAQPRDRPPHERERGDGPGRPGPDDQLRARRQPPAGARLVPARCRGAELDDHRARRLGALHAARRQPLRRHDRHHGDRAVGPPRPGVGARVRPQRHDRLGDRRLHRDRRPVGLPVCCASSSASPGLGSSSTRTPPHGSRRARSSACEWSWGTRTATRSCR